MVGKLTGMFPLDFGHEWYGQTTDGKILVFSTAKGSSAWSIAYQALRFVGKSPKAYITKECNPQTALGAVVVRVPAVTEFDQDPTEVIATGDWVKVDADKSLVEITKKQREKLNMKGSAPCAEKGGPNLGKGKTL